MMPHLEVTDAYRLIIIRRNATEILLTTKHDGGTLPRVEIPKHQRVAERLTQEVRRAWELETFCLLVKSSGAPAADANAATAILECVNENQESPRGSDWMPVQVAVAGSCAEDAAAIRDAFAELAFYTSGEKQGPFARPGSLRELLRWTSQQTAALGVRLTGNFQQYNAGPTFSLVCLETDSFALWFKATGEPNVHELSITKLLAERFPSHVPRILGVHSSWNAWLSAEAEGTPLDELTDCSSWERAAEELANLQIASIGHAAELVDGECKDLRLPLAARHIDRFVSRMGAFMRVQEKVSPPPLVGTELLALREGLKEAVSLLESLGFPDTLGHLDCNPGNLIVSSERCTFLDWAEACVTNPVITFEYLRRHMERCGVTEPAAASRITAAYARPWRAHLSSDDLLRALSVAPPVAVFLHAVAGEAWRTLDPISSPRQAAYFRSLTRRIYRDAILAAERSERCLN